MARMSEINNFDGSEFEEVHEIYDLSVKLEEDLAKLKNKNVQDLESLKENNLNKLNILKKAAALEEEQQIKKNNELKSRLFDAEIKHETTYNNAKWREEEKNLLNKAALVSEIENNNELENKKLANEANADLLKDIDYQAAYKKNKLLEVENAIAEEKNKLAQADIDREIKKEATINNAKWKEDEKEILKTSALQAEKDKNYELEKRKFELESNKALLEDANYQAEHKKNKLLEVENTIAEEEAKRAQEKIDRETLSNDPNKLTNNYKKAQWAAEDKRRAEEDAHEAKLQDKRNKYAELLAKKGKTASKEELEKAEKNFEKQVEREEEIDKIHKERQERQEAADNLSNALTQKGLSMKERAAMLSSAVTGDDGNFSLEKAMSSALTAISSYMQSLNTQIEEIASYKSTIDTRLQGTTKKSSGTSSGGVKGLLNKVNSLLSDGYWDDISKQITGAAGISPYVKQEDIASQVKTLVESGINTNVAQRAFVQTIKDKVAATFDATNGTLLRLVRIQQQDSTAARLGMESMITQFLNNMYENTEYLNSVSTSVKSSLEEAMSLMTAEDAISFEYQVQKWLGSYYSVGVSQNAVTSIASSLGKIASGDISGITEGGVGNLVVMAANQAGLSIADVLTTGLDDSETNQLMQAMSGYLYDIMQSSSDNLVVQQQIANVYGMTAADLKAIANLYTDNGKTISNIAKSSSTYSESMSRLNEMISTIYKRESVSEMMTNAFDNLQYTISAGIANNPVLYATYKVAGMLEDIAGGIEIPMISVMGNTVDLHTSVAQLLQVATLSGSLLSGIGQMISSGGGGGITTSGLAKAFGISEGSGMTSVSRGGGIGGSMQTVTKGSSVSDSGYVGNENGSDVKEKTMTDASQDSTDQLATAQEEDDEKTNTDLYNNTSEIITLINAIIDGSKSMHVKVDDYGLTGWN